MKLLKEKAFKFETDLTVAGITVAGITIADTSEAKDIDYRAGEA
jgi:hypothetical protein